MMKLFFLLIWFAICAEQDARCKQISNGLTLGATALAIIYLALTGMTWLGSPALEALLAVTLAWALTLPGYALGKLGAADVKLMTALALASPWQPGLSSERVPGLIRSNGLRNATGI